MEFPRENVLKGETGLSMGETTTFHRPPQLWIARNPPGFAFIDFEDFRDAEDAVRKLDGGSSLTA